MATTINGTALFSECGRYRYKLTRDLPSRLLGRCGGDLINFVMLNPSTADAEKDDRTVAKCRRWAIKWGFNRLVVTNLFGWRSTDPKALYRVEDPIGPKNDWTLLETAKEADMVVAAWGRHGRYGARSLWFLSMYHKPIFILRMGELEPYHPLYLPNDTKPFLWER